MSFNPPRSGSNPKDRRDSRQDWTTCPVHGKRAYTSRKAARRAMGAHHQHDSGMREYPCDAIPGAWHFGHLHALTKSRGFDPWNQVDETRGPDPDTARKMANVYHGRPTS